VQQRANRLILVGAVLHGDRGHAEDVRHVGDARPLALLSLVNLVGVHQRGFETRHVA